MKVERAKHDANVENKHVGDIVIPKIKVRLPKADISIYDFDDDDNSIGGGIMPKVENEVKPSPLEVKQPAAKSSAKSTSAGLKLKMSGGKIVTGSQESGTTLPKSSHTGRFQLLGGGSAVKKESLSEFDSDNSDDQLVVDETPRKRKRENKSASTIKPGSLKLKLSVNRTPVSSAGVGGYPNPLDRFGSFPNSQESLTFGTGVPKEEGAAVGKPGPGTNGSIADILQAASTYSSGSHVSSAKSPRIPSLGETSDTSPSMQDAIQGMLCMSQMGGSLTVPSASPPGHSTLGWTSPGRLVKPTTPQKYVYDDDGIDKMPTCYKDDEFVYPTLDTSDTEDPHVFKPRGKQKRDDTWNPKAKLQPNCPKPERPQRQGTRRESVESGLAAAAAKLANAPMAKRQYIRHKPKQDKPSYSTLLNPQPGTSSTNKLASTSDTKRSHITTPESPPKAVKKARKGMATAKQRLGRILKMHKMIH
ncbi:Histone lysine demethylase PHF8 [Lamellibrachia satsuma]|nr:Histone lysine demethylase PHF8 [Lamellibrachia satsuma]